MIDTHTHLDALDDSDAVVARAREAGVGRILTVGTDVAGSRRALELADTYDGVYAVLGIHPHGANDATDVGVAESRRSTALGNVALPANETNQPRSSAGSSSCGDEKQ